MEAVPKRLLRLYLQLYESKPQPFTYLRYWAGEQAAIRQDRLVVAIRFHGLLLGSCAVL